MKSAPRIHTQKQNPTPRYEISEQDAHSLWKISDNTTFTFSENIIAREWQGEKHAQRYALVQTQWPKKYRLVPVDQNHEGKTFIVRDTRPEKKTFAPSVTQRTSSRFRSLLPVLGIVAFLSLDAYILHKMSKKDSGASRTEEKGPHLPQDSQIPAKNIKIADIIDKNQITLDDFVLNNPSILSSIDVPWEWFLDREITPAFAPNVSPAHVAAFWSPFDALLKQWKTLENISKDGLIQQYTDEYHTVLEGMIASECVQKNGEIPKDMIGWSDLHKWEQYAGININSAKTSNNPEKLQHAQEIADCYARGDQKKLRELVKTYYLLYYFPSISSRTPAISAFLFDTSMNRGANSLQPICKMAMNTMTGRKYTFSEKTEPSSDREWKAFVRHTWDIEWLPEHQKAWDILCLKNPQEVMHHLRKAREVYEDGTYGPRPSLRPGLEKRWDNAQKYGQEMLLPATYRTISYHDSVALIEKSLTEDVELCDSVGKPIIYRVQRIQNPTKEQLKAEEIYKHTLAQPRPKKEMVLFHGTASGILGVADERTRDLGWFNAIYKSSAAAYVITGEGLIFEFFDSTKWYGAANATRIAESTGILKEDFNFNDACVAVEECLRAYQGGPFENTEQAKYGVEPPTDIQKKSSLALTNYLKQKLWIKHIGTSADPVRDHTKCYDEKGRVLLGPKYLVPKAHSDDFSPEDREKMGIMSAEEMAKIFSAQWKLSQIFGFELNKKSEVAVQ